MATKMQIERFLDMAAMQSQSRAIRELTELEAVQYVDMWCNRFRDTQPDLWEQAAQRVLDNLEPYTMPVFKHMLDALRSISGNGVPNRVSYSGAVSEGVAI